MLCIVTHQKTRKDTRRVFEAKTVEILRGD